MAKILFVTYGGGHVNAVVPLIQKLQKEHDVHVMGLTIAVDVLNQYGIQFFGYKEFQEIWHPGAYDLGLNIVDEIGPGIINRSESIAYLGNNVAELQIKYGREEGLLVFKKEGRSAFYPLIFFERLIKNISPDLVVATNSPRSERAAIQASRNLGVKAVCIGDLFLMLESEWIAKNDFSDCVCVLNEEVKNFLISKGRKDSHIKVTGNPAFDYLSVYKNNARRLEIRKKRGWLDKKVILWAVQYESLLMRGSEGDNIVELVTVVSAILNDILRCNSEYHLVVRYHPAHTGPKSKLVDGCEIDDTSRDVADSIVASDLVLVSNSTVGLQASILGIPVISFDFSKYSVTDPYSKMGISIGCPDLSDLKYKIFKVFNGDLKLNKFCVETGSATEACLSEIKSILGE